MTKSPPPPSSTRIFQRRNTQSNGTKPSAVELDEYFSDRQPTMFSGSDGYAGLGQNPNSKLQRGKFSARSLIRLAAIVVGVLTVGYLGLWAFRSNSHPQSAASKVDPRLQSKHCDVPHPGRPLIQYVLMLDAGSTGSRIHAYKFNYCKDHPEMEDELFKMIEPGLSSFENDPKAAAHSLDSLMEVAMKGVPETLWGCTPVAVKATAGLRALGPVKSKQILEAVNHHLSHDYPFPLIPHNPVEVMDGKDEGVYAWITVNYLLGTLGKAEHRTAATFDLGGGSTQIVFEPWFEQYHPNVKGRPQLAPGEHQYDMVYGGQNYTLYQHSYLGYGLMAARKAIKKMIAQEASDQGKFSVEHPCFPEGFREELTINDGKSQVIIKGIQPAKAHDKTPVDACYQAIRKVLKKEKPCPQPPCAFDGVYQPELDKTFPDNPFYIFSYFYDRTYPLGVRDEFKLADIKTLRDKVCGHDIKVFNKQQQEEVSTNYDYCLDLSFEYALLRDGVGMSDDRVVRSTKKINDAETGWCLGASLAVLDQARYCKA